jgi:hypothetical protein
MRFVIKELHYCFLQLTLPQHPPNLIDMSLNDHLYPPWTVAQPTAYQHQPEEVPPYTSTNQDQNSNSANCHKDGCKIIWGPHCSCHGTTNCRAPPEAKPCADGYISLVVGCKACEHKARHGAINACMCLIAFAAVIGVGVLLGMYLHLAQKKAEAVGNATPSQSDVASVWVIQSGLVSELASASQSFSVAGG